MSKYTPTQNPGETRTRARAINIRLPLNSPLTIEVLEQSVVRVLNNDEVVADNQAGRLEIVDSADARAFAFPLRSFETDQELGASGTGVEALTYLYSMIRAYQDAAESEE